MVLLFDSRNSSKQGLHVLAFDYMITIVGWDRLEETAARKAKEEGVLLSTIGATGTALGRSRASHLVTCATCAVR